MKFLSLQKLLFVFCNEIFYLGQRLPRGHLMPEHEVGQDTGGAPGHPHLAVDEDLAPGRQSLVDEVHHLVEVDRDVGLGHVNQLDAFVGDAPGLVIFLKRNQDQTE